tara:strand:- start:1891 stop:2454 length:564 start_codon:yes stop_codon:yes gene_type:complete
MVKKIVVLVVFFLLVLFLFFKFVKDKKPEVGIKNSEDENTYNSNILENVEYISKDTKGNEYIIRAARGEIDFNNNDIIFLEEVSSLIKLTNSNVINITSDFGKYNAANYDTIFSKNVIITYLENKIRGEYLDFSLIRNKMIISKNVIYNNYDNILNADVIEMDMDTKDTKIFMYEQNKKVNIKSKDY